MMLNRMKPAADGLALMLVWLDQKLRDRLVVATKLVFLVESHVVQALPM